MREDPLLLNPGATPAAREVRRAADAPTGDPRSADFATTDGRACDGPGYVSDRSIPSPDGELPSDAHPMTGGWR